MRRAITHAFVEHIPATLKEGVDDPVLRVAGSFTELHDYCDANCLGEQEAFLDSCGWTGNDEAKDQAALVASTDILNNAQTIVDYWLRALHN